MLFASNEAIRSTHSSLGFARPNLFAFIVRTDFDDVLAHGRTSSLRTWSARSPFNTRLRFAFRLTGRYSCFPHLANKKNIIAIGRGEWLLLISSMLASSAWSSVQPLCEFVVERNVEMIIKFGGTSERRKFGAKRASNADGSGCCELRGKFHSLVPCGRKMLKCFPPDGACTPNRPFEAKKRRASC